jgi:hypothetical protein
MFPLIPPTSATIPRILANAPFTAREWIAGLYKGHAYDIMS